MHTIEPTWCFPYVHEFMDDQLRLGHLSGCSSVEKTDSPFPINHGMSVDLLLKMRAVKILLPALAYQLMLFYLFLLLSL